MSQLNRVERERLVIDMCKKRISPKETAHQLKMSLRDVYKIINKHFGAKEKELTTEHQAILLFMKGKRPIDVTIKLRITLQEATSLYIRYKESFYLGKFGQDYKYIQGYMPQLAEICEVMKKAGLNIKEVVDEYNAYISSTRDLAELQKIQLDLMRSNETLKRELEALGGERDSLVNYIENLKSEVEELERRYSLTNEFLNYPGREGLK
jgi:hypothetical protein